MFVELAGKSSMFSLGRAAFQECQKVPWWGNGRSKVPGYSLWGYVGFCLFFDRFHTQTHIVYLEPT